MRLAPVEAVRARAFLPDREDVNAGVAAALDAATEALESELRTEFAFRARSDLFRVADSRLRGSRFHSKFRLSAGLVDESSAALSVLVAPLAVAFEPENPGPAPTDLRDPSESGVDSDDEFVEVDATHGVVTVQDYRLLNQYVLVQYEAGLAVTPGDAGLYLQSGARSVPSWLRELAVLYAVRDVELTPRAGGPSRDDRAGVATRARMRDSQLGRRVEVLLDRYRRYFPDAHRPVQAT